MSVTVVESRIGYAANGASSGGGGGGDGEFMQLVFLGDAGYGSTNTAIRYFTDVDTANQGDFTYDNSATDGLSVTIPADGVYRLTALLRYDTANDIGMSVNATGGELTSNLSTISASHIITFGSVVSSQHTNICVPDAVLSAGDVVRVHTVPGHNATAGQFSYFRISKVRDL